MGVTQSSYERIEVLWDGEEVSYDIPNHTVCYRKVVWQTEKSFGRLGEGDTGYSRHLALYTFGLVE
jgi:hypothetical protein